jgi:hypothetical protein
MSLPIEPETGLFPTDDEPAFVRSPEVEELASEVMAAWPEFEPIRTAIDEGLTIAYVFETKLFDPTKDEYKRHVVSKVSKASPLWQCLAEVRLAIQFRQWFWERYTPEQRAAVIYHELKHIDVDLDSAPPKVSLRPHEIEEFYGVARRYGAVLPDIANLVKVHSWWQQVGNRKTGRVLVLCAHGPLVEVKGDPHGAGTLACLARRARIDVARWGPGPVAS